MASTQPHVCSPSTRARPRSCKAAAKISAALALLHQTHAPFVVTVLAMVFTAQRQTVAVADAHAEINDALDQLRAAGTVGLIDPGDPTRERPIPELALVGPLQGIAHLHRGLGLLPLLRQETPIGDQSPHHVVSLVRHLERLEQRHRGG